MSESSEQQTILIVDDEPGNIRILLELLRADFMIKVAINGETALKLAHSETPPDLILLDVVMPGIDGHEVCRRLKADPQTRDIPIIFITGKTDAADETLGFEIGAVDYISKPFNPLVVKARVETHLELRRTCRNLQQAIRLREEVERIARHDLKTPLNSIASIPGLLREMRPMTAEEDELLGIVEGAAHRVLDMVNLSLDLYRIEDGTYTFVPQAVNLSAITQSVLRDLDGHANSKAISLQCGDCASPVWVRGDDVLCYSIVANLLKNAIEAAPDGSIVRISLQGGERIRLSIHNLGAVPQAIRSSFFEKYVTHGKVGGTGLGTYSARLMARVQQGELTLETSDEAGTTLTLELDRLPDEEIPALAAESGPTSPRAENRPHELPPLRILLVDDDPYNVLILKKYLPSPPLEVETAVNGRAAVDAILNQRPDIIFMDLEMPVMCGTEAMRQIRQLQSGLGQPPSKIIAFSADASEAHQQQCRQAGFDLFQRKPATRPELLALLTAEEFRHKKPEKKASADEIVWVDEVLKAQIENYLVSRRTHSEEMLQAAITGDRETIRHLAHKLCGSLGLFGFEWASRHCAGIEENAMDEALPLLKSKIESLIRHFDNVEIRIRP